VTAGAWTRQVFPNFPVPLRPTRQQVLYFRPPDPATFAPGRFPVFFRKGEGDLNDFYAMPDAAGLGIKVARHGGPDVDPDDVDRTVGDEYRATVRRFLRSHLPTLVEAPIDRIEVCLYTMAPDEQFRVGSLIGHPDVLVASPCSGHGFKFSCLVGRVLADLATLGRTEIAINFWRIEPT
jgi:sarcosine oxidase